MISNNKNISVVGCGYWGKNIINTVHKLNKLHSVFDFNDELLSDFNNKYNLNPRSLDEIFVDESVEGIMIATPAESHYEIASNALKHKKHVFIEKPICIEISDAKKLIDEARNSNLVLMVGHLLHYSEHFQYFKKIVEKKKKTLNPIKIKSVRKSYGKIRSNEDVLWSFAPHDISMVLSFFDEAKIENPKTFKNSYFGNSICDYSLVGFNLNGTFIEVESDWTSYQKLQRLEVSFADESFFFEDSSSSNKKIYSMPYGINKGDLANKINYEPIFYELEETETPLTNECAHFIDCIENNNTPKTDGNEAIRVLEALKVLS